MPKRQPFYTPRRSPDEREHRRQLADANNQLQDIVNSVNQITLDASTVRTQFSTSFINEESFIGFTPVPGSTAAVSATELASGNMYVETVRAETTTAIPNFDIAHDSTSTAVFTYNMVIIG
ncbi:MAG: hypothetical protein GTN99_07025 [Candidatus Dadabacteria bacterium]|nr:hypothetical protein [Candidatus Dadabacteria bacterium]